MTTTTGILSLDHYQTRLPSFEGPLDLLLHLIERQRLDINEVSLVAVTDHFLEYMSELTEHTPNIVAEFASVGTRLTVLKSRSLLPRQPVVEEEETPDPDDLVEQLKAYQQLKKAASNLSVRLDEGYISYPPLKVGPVITTRDTGGTRLKSYEPRDLVRMLRRRLSVVPEVVQAIRTRRIISIREMTERVLQAIKQGSRVSFQRVTEDATTRTERATAFLAVLVLVRRRLIDVDQQAMFGDIQLIQGTETDTHQLENMEEEFVN